MQKYFFEHKNVIQKLPWRIRKKKSYVGLFFHMWQVLRRTYYLSYVGLIISYVGDIKSYEGDIISYVGDNKYYVGLAFVYV